MQILMAFRIYNIMVFNTFIIMFTNYLNLFIININILIFIIFLCLIIIFQIINTCFLNCFNLLIINF